ncbi:M10 family metallopeptidase [Rhizobium sp. YIM 134829]|uniref:M10 family metallopeptidase n=1 Tax=Rhizobium sp. YIM 134829 TaxID=3390453 RepID=UPI00397D1D93
MTIKPGDSLGGNLTFGDADWIKVILKKGYAYEFEMRGSVSWSALEIRDQYGALADRDNNDRDDDFSTSTLKFVAQKTGTYFIRAGSAYDDRSGTYELATKVITAPDFASYDKIAKQLATDYHKNHDKNPPQSWPLKAGGTLTVNLSGLSKDGRQLAEWALDAWTGVSGIKFKVVAGTAKIKFDDRGSIPQAHWSSAEEGKITSATVDVPVSWLKQYGTHYNSYSLATYIHEIGHALGLGHAGNYNYEATLQNTLFANDTKQLSIMSYWNVNQNEWVAASNAPAVTPMIADVLAIQKIYGKTAINIGDTKHKLKPVFIEGDARITLVDTAGIDTVDASWSARVQKINLNAEAFSSIDGGLNNLSLARGTDIENAIGGKANDFLYGSSKANMLEGRDGNDTMVGGAGNDLLSGGRGSDHLTGGAGRDTFIFSSKPEADSVDLIIDFNVKLDTIQLSAKAFSEVGADGALLHEAFVVGDDAGDASDRIIYDLLTGKLYYDDDGSGSHAKQLVATLDNHAKLTSDDFIIS